MTDGAETIHVVFGRSTADTLRAALPLMGGVGRVIGQCDNLGVGPIDPPDSILRQRWADAVLRLGPTRRDDPVADASEIEQAWAAATFA